MKNTSICRQEDSLWTLFFRHCAKTQMAAPLAASPSHAGVADEMLAGTGCAPAYEALELCLADHDRSFAKCADETAAFRQCMDAFADQKLELVRQRNEAQAHAD